MEEYRVRVQTHNGGCAALIWAYVPFWYVRQPAGLVTDPGTGCTLGLPNPGCAQAVFPRQFDPANVVYRPSWLPPSPAKACSRVRRCLGVLKEDDWSAPHERLENHIRNRRNVGLCGWFTMAIACASPNAGLLAARMWQTEGLTRKHICLM